MSQHLSVEVNKALHLLHSLTNHDPPVKPLGELNPKYLKHCKGVFFYHTTKVGLGLGYKWGNGLLVIRKQDAGSDEAAWSAPCMFTVHSASIGLSAGMSTVQTVLILGTSSALECFKSRTAGKGGLVLGQDVKITAVSDLGWGAMEDAGSVLSGGTQMLNPDVVQLSADITGVMLDWSLVGGSVNVDTAFNEQLYGQSATVQSILEGSGAASLPLQECQPLYEALDEISAAADADPRSFSGFKKKWKPHAILASEVELRKLE